MLERTAYGIFDRLFFFGLSASLCKKTVRKRVIRRVRESVCVCVCVCVREGGREREREREKEREREREEREREEREREVEK